MATINTRIAIIIQAADTPGEIHLPGAVADARRMFDLLHSSQGGAWDAGELNLLCNPRWEDVAVYLCASQSCEYCVLGYFGHGRHIPGGRHDGTLLALADHEVTVAQLTPLSARSLSLFDTCRKPAEAEPLLKKAADQFTGLKLDHYRDAARGRHRDLFDLALAASDIGPVRVFSCAENETVTDQPEGALFTTEFLAAAGQWAMTGYNKQSVLTLDALFNAAEHRTNVANVNQHPEYYSTKRNRHFPVAVVA